MLRRSALPALILAALAGCADPPVGGVVVITPETPRTTDDLVASIGEEAVPANDRFDVTYAWSWTVDGQIVTDLTGDSVPAARTTKGETWTATAIASDGKRAGVPFATSVTIANTPPEVSVALAPTTPLTADDLVATPSATDADGDEVTFAYAWTRDGQGVGDVDGPTVPAARTARGETWEVTVTGGDGETDGPFATASVTIGNTPPNADSVTIAPADPRTTTTLVATAAVSDADGDATTVRWRWFVDGAAVGGADDDTLSPDAFVKGQRVAVEIVPNDGDLDGAARRSDEVLILNTPPVVGSVTLDPSAATVLDTLTCRPAGVADADADAVTLRYAWFVDGAEQSVTTATLGLDAYRKGQRVVCSVTPNDGEADGAAVASAALTIGNAAPTAPEVVITPEDADAFDDLVCEVTADAIDPDGDALTYVVTWTRNGETWDGDTATTTIEGDTIPDASVNTGDTWTCSVAADDGAVLGPEGESAEIVVKAPPVTTLTGVCGRTVPYFCGGNCTANTADFATAYCKLAGFSRAVSYTTHASGVVYGTVYYNWRELGSESATPTTCDRVYYSGSYGTASYCTCVSNLTCE